MEKTQSGDPVVIALAVDGMEHTLLNKWIEDGNLPNLSAIRAEGVSGTANCSSTSSATQWTTHFTGVGPDRHGVDGFLTRDEKRSAGDKAPDAGELVNLSNIRTKTYPELLDENGVSVGLINPLPIWPPLELENGFCISGMLTPPSTDRWVYPDTLEDEIDKYNYKIDVKYAGRPYGFVDDDLFDEVSLDQLYEDMFDVLDSRIEFIKHAIDTKEIDYLYALLKSIDIIQHTFWAHMIENDSEFGDAILESYERVDELVGWVRDNYDTNLLVFSDHGFQSRLTDPPSGLQTVARSIADIIPIPKIAKQTYNKTIRRPVATAADGPNVKRTTGVHANPASWLLSGPIVETTGSVDIEFEDIPPTILAMLDQSIPEEYIGKPLSALRTTPSFEPRQLSVHRDISIKDNEVISQRLHNLGYAEMVDEE